VFLALEVAGLIVAVFCCYATATVVASAIFDRVHARRLRKQGRFVRWDDVVDLLGRGQGTLIFNRSTLPGRVWWVVDDVPDDNREALAAIESTAKATSPPLHLLFRLTALRRLLPRARIVEARGVIRSHPM
jgi:hypothetical protein